MARLAVGMPVALRASGWRSAGFGVTGVLAVRRSVRWAEIRPDVDVVRFCAWNRVVPVVCDRICWKAAPQTTSRKTCRTCFPRCRNPRALQLRPCGQRLTRCRPHHRLAPPASAPIWLGAAQGRATRPSRGRDSGPMGRPDGQTGSGRRGCVGARSAQRDGGFSCRALPRWTSGPGDQAEVGPASVDPARTLSGPAGRPSGRALPAGRPGRRPTIHRGGNRRCTGARRTADPATACPVRQRVATWQPVVESPPHPSDRPIGSPRPGRRRSGARGRDPRMQQESQLGSRR
jgi:hypothetical protein